MIRTRKSGWFQFSLRAVLLLTAMVACFFGGWQAHEQQLLAPVGSRIPPIVPPFPGVVLEVDGKKNLCELSLGKDDGVKVGAVFIISRGTTIVAQVTVKATHPDRCVGVIEAPQPKSMLDRFGLSRPVVVRKGDLAAPMVIAKRSLLDEFLAEQPGFLERNGLGFECGVTHDPANRPTAVPGGPRAGRR